MKAESKGESKAEAKAESKVVAKAVVANPSDDGGGWLEGTAHDRTMFTLHDPSTDHACATLWCIVTLTTLILETRSMKQRKVT